MTETVSSLDAETIAKALMAKIPRVPLDALLWTAKEVTAHLRVASGDFKRLRCLNDFPRRCRIADGRWFAGEVIKWARTNDCTKVLAERASPPPSSAEMTDPLPSALDRITGLYELPLNTGSGIYFLCQGDTVLYVGQSTSIVQRIARHLRDREILFDRVFFVSCQPESLTETEAKFIRELRPRLNIFHNNDSK